MTIAEARGKCKGLLVRIPRDVLVITVLVLSASASFALGYLAGIDEGKGTDLTPESFSSAVFAATSTTGQFVASKNGTKYYPSDCAGANRISDENKVWFASAAAAAEAGYAPAANCK